MCTHSEFSAGLKSRKMGRVYALWPWSYLGRRTWGWPVLLSGRYQWWLWLGLSWATYFLHPGKGYWLLPQSKRFGRPKATEKPGGAPPYLQGSPGHSGEISGRNEMGFRPAPRLRRGREEEGGWATGHPFLPFWQNVTFIPPFHQMPGILMSLQNIFLFSWVRQYSHNMSSLCGCLSQPLPSWDLDELWVIHGA